MLRRIEADVQETDAGIYPFNIPAVKNLRSLLLHKKVTFFVGDNGSGKSTLLEAIAVRAGCSPEGGSKNMVFSTKESYSELYKYISLVYDAHRNTDAFFLRAESFFNTASAMEEINGIYAMRNVYGDSLHSMSHGESFLSLVLNRFGGSGLYFLDEPEAALSALGQLTLLVYLNDLTDRGAQFVIATHSPIITAFPDSLIYEIGSEGISERKYDELEFVRLYKNILNDPGGFISRLFAQ